MSPGVEVHADAEEGTGLTWRSRTSDTHGWWTAAIEIPSTIVSKMEQVPSSLVGCTLPLHEGDRVEPKLQSQPQRGPEFAGFWTDQSFIGSNKPVELPRPMDETKPVAKSLEADSGAPNLGVDSPKPAEKTPPVAADGHSLTPVGESLRKTKPVDVDLAPTGPKRGPEAPIRSEILSTISHERLLGQGQGQALSSNPARVHSVQISFQRQQSSKAMDAKVRRVDEASILSSRRSSGRHSSRSLCQGILLEETIKNNPPHVLPQPPGSDGVIHLTKVEGSGLKEEVFPGNTNSLAQLKVGNSIVKSTETLSRVSKHPGLGGSSRVTPSSEPLGVIVPKAPSSLPASPCSSSKESRASKLFRKFRPSGSGSRVGNGDGKLSKEKGSKVVNYPIVSQHQMLAKSWEQRKPETRNGVRSNQGYGKPSEKCPKSEAVNGSRTDHVPTIQSECLKVDSNSIAGSESGAQPNVRSQEGNAALQEHSTHKSSSRWLFKWKWGSKPTAKITMTTVKCVESSRALKAVNTHLSVSPTLVIMSDARNAFQTKSDRFSSGGSGAKIASGNRSSHKRRSSWGCASHASTATLTSGTRIIQRSSFRDNNGATDNSQSNAGDVDGSRVSSVDFGSQSFRDCQESFRMMESPRKGLGSFRSAGGWSFRKSDVFEDCHGSFRSIGSPASYSGSFRSADSPSMSRNDGRSRYPSVEEMEWDSRLPPPLQGDQTLTIGDVAALCPSSVKFVFKCREIQHFNRFLRTQKKRLLSGSEKGSTDCFHVILSGTEIEVSSMVASVCYAWLLENTVPKVTGETWHAVPVIDIPRHQMHKHKDAAWLFDACGVDAAALLYANEIEMGSLVGAGRMKISTIGQDVLVTKNEVGSVCTLLGEKLLAEAQCLLEPRYMKTFLLAGVLLDTENLDFASMRDTEMTTMLLVGSGSLGRNGFFNQLRGVEDDKRVSEFITRNYGDGKQVSDGKICSPTESKVQEEADQEQSDKDSLFTQSQDQASTSEAGTSCSSLDEDSPRLKQRSSFKCTKGTPHSAPARSHHLPSPSSAGCNEDEKAVAHIRKAATRSASSGIPACGARSPNLTRIRKRLFIYQA